MIKISNQENKKPFDPTTCFTFFGSWLKSIEALETEQDKNSTAYTLFKAIANYSMYDIEPDFSNNPILNAFWILVEKEIDISIGNRKRGFADDELNAKYQSIINAIVEHPKASLREIGSITGTDKEMVRRIKKKYAEQIQTALDNAVTVDANSNSSVNVDANPNNSVNNDFNYNDYDTVSDSMRQDTDETARQFNFNDENLPF